MSTPTKRTAATSTGSRLASSGAVAKPRAGAMSTAKKTSNAKVPAKSVMKAPPSTLSVIKKMKNMRVADDDDDDYEDEIDVAPAPAPASTDYNKKQRLLLAQKQKASAAKGKNGCPPGTVCKKKKNGPKIFLFVGKNLDTCDQAVGKHLRKVNPKNVFYADCGNGTVDFSAYKAEKVVVLADFKGSSSVSFTGLRHLFCIPKKGKERDTSSVPQRMRAVPKYIFITSKMGPKDWGLQPEDKIRAVEQMDAVMSVAPKREDDGTLNIKVVQGEQPPKPEEIVADVAPVADPEEIDDDDDDDSAPVDDEEEEGEEDDDEDLI